MAIVTGGASGIGGAIAHRLAADGHRVLFFASVAARPITNQVLAVDSGFSIA